MKDPRRAKEDATQAAIVELLKLTAHPQLIWFHCPNGALLKASQRIYFSRLGVVPGVADLPFTLPDGRSAYIEVKAKDGRQSPEQITFQRRCEEIGVPYEIARSSWEAEEILGSWGALR